MKRSSAFFARWFSALPACILLVVTACAGRAAEAYTGWLKLSTPEFTVVTPLRQAEAIAWAGEFSQYVAALRSYFKAADRRLPPLTFVVFARVQDFDGYRPLGADGRPTSVAAFFLRHESWAVAGTGGTALPEPMRHAIFHEGVHWFNSNAEVAHPIWLEEGLAEVFSTFEIVQGQAEWGRSLDDHVRHLRGRGLLPLEKLTTTDRRELFGEDRDHTGLVYAQSWAFAHYLIFGVHKIPPTALTEYGRLTRDGLPAGEAFRRAFGKTYQEMDDELKRYVGSGNYYLNRVPLVPFSTPRVDPATRLEVEEALARLALGARRWEQAAAHGRNAVTAQAGDPRGHEVLALALKELGDRKGALAEFARAEELGSKDAQVYFELAAEDQNGGGTAGRSPQLSPGFARRVADRYGRAIALYPGFRPAYQNLAGLVGQVEPVTADDRRWLELGQKRWPHDAPIEVGLAVLQARAGDRAAARARLERLVADGTGEGAMAKNFARRLLDTWTLQDIALAVKERVEARKFAEALAYVEERLAGELPDGIRPQVTGMRQPLRDGLAGVQIDQALRGRRWAEARRLLNAVVAGEGLPDAKEQARRMLATLDRDGLGLEPAAK